MNANLSEQKPTIYKYQKSKSIKKTKNKFRKNSSIYSIISIVLIVISSYFITQNFYLSKNSKDLSYAVEYAFTKSNTDNSLLRVKYMTLISCDGNSATVEASGLSKSKPHHTISIIGNFSKDNNQSWHLVEISDISNSIGKQN